jgi:hypothetical protein
VVVVARFRAFASVRAFRTGPFGACAFNLNRPASGPPGDDGDASSGSVRRGRRRRVNAGLETGTSRSSASSPPMSEAGSEPSAAARACKPDTNATPHDPAVA